nr:retrovirus-related Pol polyprotein from transposon TNT 1-94 [Tanacetum cinerariifolium]
MHSDSYEVPGDVATTGSASDGTGKKKERTITLTTDDMQKRKNDVKARTTLLLSLPDEHQLQFKIEHDDLNQKFLTSLAPEWLMHMIVWRNRSDLDTMSLDDLYNHLKVYESKVQKKSESNSQNMAFISSTKHSSGNEKLNIASVSTASTNVSTASTNFSTASTNIGIDEDDMEEIDIKWNMALLSMRADRFWKKTGKKISIQGTDVTGFDKSKVECFNCHKMGHFARECRAPKSQDRGRRDNYRQGSKVKEHDPKALMAIDGVGWNWSYMANDEENHALIADEETPIEFALMAKTNAESEVFHNSLYSKAYNAQNRNPFVTETEASPSTISPKPFIKFVKANGSPTKSKTDKVETTKKPHVKKFPIDSTKFSTVDMGKKGNAVKASAGCSRHMIGNISYLSDYDPFDRGYVSFGQGGCKITGKGTIKTECIVLGRDFKLVPHKDLTCLVAKASADEGMLWHMRLGHLNFKTMNRFTWTFFFETKDETSGILRKFITEIENLKDLKVKIIRCDNGGEFRNKEMNDFCSQKGINREFSNARTPQHNGVAERRNMTLIEAARTMLDDSKLPVTFWAEVVSTACYVQNMVLVNKSHNKTPYELFNGRTPALGFLKPFGCHVMILNTLDNLGKFEAKGNEGFFIGYSMSSKAFRVFNKKTKRVEENLHIDFLENKAIEKGAGPNWLFDIDSLTKSMNYVPVVVAGTNSTNFLGTKDATSQEVKKDVSSLRYIALPNWDHDALLESSSSKPQDDCSVDVPESSGYSNPTAASTNPPADQIETLTVETPIPIVNCPKGVRPIGTKWVVKNKKDKRGIVIRNKARLVAQGHTQKEEIDYDEVFAPIARIEAIRLFLAYASFMGFTDPEFPARVYKVEKAMYRLHQAPRAWLSMPCEALSMEISSSILRLYALTFKPTVYVSHIRQFWSTARIETTKEGTKILATIDGNLRTVSESSIRQNLKLNDEAGISSLSDAELFENLTLMGYNISLNQKFTFQKGTPTEPHHTPSPEAQQTSPTLPPITTTPIPTVTPSDTPHLRQYTRRARIAESSALPPVADEPTSPLRDVSQSKACPTVSSLDAEQDMENIAKTFTLPHESTSRVPSLAADEGSLQLRIQELTDLYTSLQRQQSDLVSKFEARELEITMLKARVKLLKDREGGVAERSGDDAPIKGGVPTCSDVVPTATLIFATATVVSPYTKRKRKEKMIEFETLEKKKIQEQIDIQMARQLEDEMERDAQRINEQIARDAEIARIHAEEELQIMIDGLDRSNETEEAKRFKRKGIRFEQESVKKLKTSEEVNATEEVPKEKVKEMIQLIHVEEITRLGGSSANYQFFMDMLKHLDKEDLNKLWRLVKDSLSIRPAASDKEMELWVELKRLYEPDDEDQLWTHTQNIMHTPVEWKLYDSCRVHHVTFKDKEIFMLVEKDYPLRKGLAIVMISYKLQVENYSQMASDLILKIYKIANRPRQDDD